MDNQPKFNRAELLEPGDKGIQKSMLDEIPERVHIDRLPHRQGILFDKFKLPRKEYVY